MSDNQNLKHLINTTDDLDEVDEVLDKKGVRKRERIRKRKNSIDQTERGGSRLDDGRTNGNK